jgi:hypothetical protein
MKQKVLIFNPPPGWPRPPAGWIPPKGWTPDPGWPPAPPGWQLWIQSDSEVEDRPSEHSVLLSVDSPVLVPEPADASEREKRIALLEAENAALRARFEAVGSDVESVIELNDERVLQAVGVYRYHHPLENAIAYRDQCR